jgi:probable phosphoglycerate mutase
MPEPHEGKIILVRHGETEANRRRCFGESEDIPLTETGQRQAREIAVRLSREFRPQALVSSAFLRARQTSEIIAQVLGLATETVPGLHERDFGGLKGHPYERLAEMMARDADPPAQPWLWRPAGGESLDDVRLRAMGAIETVRTRYPGQEIVVVCHGAVIQAVCAHVTGEWAGASVPPNCGIVAIRYEAQRWVVPILSDNRDVAL